MKGDQGGDREAPFHALEHSRILQAHGLAAHMPMSFLGWFCTLPSIYQL